jgi:hypothetical protein
MPTEGSGRGILLADAAEGQLSELIALLSAEAVA